MGKSFGWINKARIQKFYDSELVLMATNSMAMTKPLFARLKPEVQSAFDSRTYIVYDAKNYWYELERRLPC